MWRLVNNGKIFRIKNFGIIWQYYILGHIKYTELCMFKLWFEIKNVG